MARWQERLWAPAVGEADGPNEQWTEPGTGSGFAGGQRASDHRQVKSTMSLSNLPRGPPRPRNNALPHPIRSGAAHPLAHDVVLAVGRVERAGGGHRVGGPEEDDRVEPLTAGGCRRGSSRYDRWHPYPSRRSQ